MLNNTYDDSAATECSQMIGRVLGRLRTRLSMDFGFVSEFQGGNRVFRYTDGFIQGFVPGAADSLSDSFCKLVIEGIIPPLMTDASKDLVARSLPDTARLPIGAHLSVPIRLSSGALFGTLCCFSHLPRSEIGDGDLALMHLTADIIADLLQADDVKRTDYLEIEKAVLAILSQRSIEMVFQPIFRLSDQRTIGFEALSRFPGAPARTPDLWFADAESVGLGVQMEFLAVEEAMAGFLRLPQPSSVSLNLSPASIASQRFATFFEALPLEHVIVEVTEHAAIESYAELQAALAPFRARGLKLAIDDVGAGYSSFRHVLDLAPDRIKLDVSLTRHVDRDPGRQALASAIALYGRRMGCETVAEGVETEAELATLTAAGVTKVQGYLISRPLPLHVARTLNLDGRPRPGMNVSAVSLAG